MIFIIHYNFDKRFLLKETIDLKEMQKIKKIDVQTEYLNTDQDQTFFKIRIQIRVQPDPQH